MLSRVVLGLPFVESKEETLYRIKQVSELGFSNLILSFDSFAHLTESSLEKYMLRVFGVYYSTFDSKNQELYLVKHHEWGVKNIFVDHGIIMPSGLSDFAVSSGFDLRFVFDAKDSLYRYNPLERYATPLHATKYIEDEATQDFALRFLENQNQRIILWPLSGDTMLDHLKHAKESLNRLFFIGIR